MSRDLLVRPTLDVAPALLGSVLVRVEDGRRVAGRIVEVEAYVGESDTACHASRGRTPRNDPLYGPPGHAYVYFTYGMHWLVNVVTEPEGSPAAVLVRALEPLEGLEVMRRRRGGRGDHALAAGPARLCRALGIDGTFQRADLVEGDVLFLESSDPVPAADVVRGPRVGVGYAAPEHTAAPWRFFIRNSGCVSSGPTGPRGRRRGRP